MHYIGVTYEYQRLLSLPDRGTERDPDSRDSFVLHALCDVQVLDFLFRRTAILGYGPASVIRHCRFNYLAGAQSMDTRRPEAA